MNNDDNGKVLLLNIEKDSIVDCFYNIDNGCVNVHYSSGNCVSIICEQVEAQLDTTNQAISRLHRLLDDNPIEYVNMVISGEIQRFCDIEAESIKSSYKIVLQSYLKQGYNHATAEALAREVMLYG